MLAKALLWMRNDRADDPVGSKSLESKINLNARFSKLQSV